MQIYKNLNYKGINAQLLDLSPIYRAFRGTKVSQFAVAIFLSG